MVLKFILKVDMDVYTSKPFADGKIRKGYISMIVKRDNQIIICVNFKGIPISAGFSITELNKTFFLKPIDK